MIAKEKKSHYICIACGIDKPENDFPIDNSVVTGRKGRCRECVNIAGQVNYRNRMAKKGVVKPPTTTKKASPARVLILDIETAPLRSYTWGLWKQNVAPVQIISDWFMLTWGAKWLFENKIFTNKLEPEEALSEDDSRISKTIWTMVNDADIVIAHNARRFDVKKLNTRFLVNELPPPMPYQVIDTLDHAKKQFAMSSNKLDYINKVLHIGRKMDTGGFELWDGCMMGDKKALKKMEDYNRVDVSILEETYLRMRPWIKPHPNIGLFIEDDVTVCPTCGSSRLDFDSKPYATTANLYELFRCYDCKAIGRSKKSIPSGSDTRSVPK